MKKNRKVFSQQSKRIFNADKSLKRKKWDCGIVADKSPILFGR